MLKTSFIVTSENCSKFFFTETTGPVSVKFPGGWGSPNNALADVQDSYVTITNILTNTKYEKIEITPSTSSTTELLYSELMLEESTSAIGTATIADGIYHFNYFILFDNNETISANFYFLSLCELECKIKALTYKFINTDCMDCKKQELKLLFLEVMALYKALIFSYQCADFCAFNKIYNNLIKLLKQYNCKTC